MRPTFFGASFGAFLTYYGIAQAFTLPPTNVIRHQSRQSSSTTRILEQAQDNEEVVDVVVIGSGVGGLSCAALSAKYGLKTLCVEAHDTSGGVAHSFDRYTSASKTIPFRFDSGPSLVSGLSKKGTNPLRQVLDAIGTADDVTWKNYDGWVVHDLADGKSFKVTTGDSNQFEAALEDKAGVNARKEFREFKEKILESGGLAEASAYIPPLALRGDYKAVASIARYSLKLLSVGPKGNLLTGSFADVMDRYNVKNPFIRAWFDYLAFALSGLDAAHTQAAAVAYMMIDLHKNGAVLDYPMGGMGSLVQALVNGLEKNGGELRLNSRVEKMLLEDGTCKGVVLSNGHKIRVNKAVVCNAPLWNMAKILEDSVSPSSDDDRSLARVKQIRGRADDMCMTGSFMHLHLGIPKKDLPDDLECHHSVLDMSIDVTAEQNMVIISIPTVFDPSLAPEGYHIVHAYTAACDDFAQWEEFLSEGETGKVGHSPNSATAVSYKKSSRYSELKDAKAEVLWKAIERVIPDVRQRAEQKGSIAIVGTPLTHRRYNQRFRGTYGPAPSPGKDIWDLAGAKTEIQNLLACGDCCFPGIGLPGVAASGTIAANTLASVNSQTQLMSELQSQGALQ